MDTIDLKGLNKAAVLAALFNASKPQGLGFLHYDPTPMTVEQAEKLLEQTTDFDYLQGRVMKIDLSGDTLDPCLYDRDNGEGAAQRAIASLQSTSDPNSAEIRHAHSVGTVRSAQQMQSQLGVETTIAREHGVLTVNLGISKEMRTVLQPKVAKAKRRNKNK